MNNQRRGRKSRTPRACGRCRVQKSKCSGSYPCAQCMKKNTQCIFDEDAQVVVVSRSYLAQLKAQLASLEQQTRIGEEDPCKPLQKGSLQGPIAISGGDVPSEQSGDSLLQQERRPDHHKSSPTHQETINGREPPATLVNPLASGYSRYFSDTSGRPIHLGTCSNWSFGRRVLVMAHESVMQTPLPLDNLNFDGTSYDLGWDPSQPAVASPISLPTPDYARYLISAVKFHCGQLFHLYDEEAFMHQFCVYHQDTSDQSTLWYVHYLILLAFGKIFVAHSGGTQKPPGADFFLQAMKRLQEFVVFDSNCNPMELTEVLCCAALYLHCIDFRAAAYRVVGQAIRVALGDGMHTEIHSQDMDTMRSERCNRVWWTVYTLDRQMSSLMGVPMGISDDQVETRLPTFPGQPQKSLAVDIQIKLSKVLAQILNTVYGAEGRIDKRYLTAMKEALRSIGSVTDQLNNSFRPPMNGKEGSICRLSSSLHVLHHQCIVVTTRPLLYTFLQTRLGQSNIPLVHVHQPGSIRSLILMCIDSAQQILAILSSLQSEGLLESFLRFDLDAIFASSFALLVATAINSALVKDHSIWLQRSYSLLDDMIRRGNMLAIQFKSEIQILDEICRRMQDCEKGHVVQDTQSSDLNSRAPKDVSDPFVLNASPMVETVPPLLMEGDDDICMNELFWHEGYTTEHLVNFAESIDLTYLDAL